MSSSYIRDLVGRGDFHANLKSTSRAKNQVFPGTDQPSIAHTTYLKQPLKKDKTKVLNDRW